MNRSPQASCTFLNLRLITTTAFISISPFIGLSQFSFSRHRLTTPSQTKLFSSHGLGLGWRKRRRSHLQLVVTAELSRSPSLNIGRDSQTLQSHDIRELRWIGPVPGDIAEVEAYCRIFRAAENLHATLMDTLCDPLTGECMVSYDSSPMEKPLMEDKIASVLGCMLSLMSKGKKDVLSGRSSIMSSFHAMDPINSVEDKLPPLAIFRGEIKRCCESLHVALESLLMPGDDRGSAVWRKLQRLKNLCYDLGFPRGDDSPMHWLLANWAPVSLFTSSDPASRESEVAFWKGGQLTDESLQWLLQKGFKTIIDLRAETVKDNFYQAALDDAIMSGKVEICRFPVEIGTAPSMKQVEKFAYLVSDKSKGPVYVHSREGVWRTSAIISRWRQYMTRKELQIVSNGKLAGSFNKVLQADGSFEIEKEDNIIKDEDETKPITSDERDADREAFSSDKTILLEKSGGNTDEANSDSILGKTVVLEEANLGEVRNVLSRDFDPLKSQLPPTNVFCRIEMSRFFKGRKITPPSFFASKRKLQILPTLREAYGSTEQKRESSEYDSALVTMNAANTNGPSLSNDLSAGPRRYFENGSGLTDKGHLLVNVEAGDVANDAFVSARNNGHAGKSDIIGTDTVTGKDENKERIDGKGNSGSGALSADLGSEVLEGNMCASTTGVVRVQSRKKAEMFLVRTDGISCTREKVTESSLAFTHPSTQQQMLMWKSVPKTVLLLKKLGPELMEEAKGVASFLHYEENMNILVEPDVHDIFARMPGFGFVHTFYSQDTRDLHEKVDFVACLGGDGVILHASNLFRGAVPPVVSFNLGSLGFLTSHTYEDYKRDLRHVIHGNNTREGVYITLRLRLRCEIYRNGKLMPGKVIDVLNEVVVDRGSNPYLSKIECYEHDRLITKVQGDGVIIATPTGSTAYSTSAGGSMVHPNVPCMLFTPICPHSLSFRPVILPDSARLELKIPEDARSNAWVSFDGQRRQQLSRGDSIKIYMSEHPLPTVNKSDQTGDWFHSLVRCLNWNERLEQRAL